MPQCQPNIQARSLLGSVRALEKQAESLYDLRDLKDNPEVVERTDTAIGTLRDVAALLDAQTPFPPQEAEPDNRVIEVERAIGWALDGIYADGRVSIADASEAFSTTLEASDRVITCESELMIPLAHDGEQALNWFSVLNYLIDRIATVLDTFRSVALRRRASETNTHRTRCDAVVAMIETLLDVFERARSWDELVRSQLGFGNELIAFTQWTAKNLGTDNHA